MAVVTMTTNCKLMQAKRGGTCNCGATVHAEDWIVWAGAIVKCPSCGCTSPRQPVKSLGPHAWKYSPGTTPGYDMRFAVRELARCLFHAARREEKAASATDEATRAKHAARAAAFRAQAEEKRADMAAKRIRYTERDVEIAMTKLAAEVAKDEAEREAEENA